MTVTSNKYLTQEYNSTDFNFPYVQAVRGEVDSNHCGLFIPISQINKCGWKEVDPAMTIEYTYNNGSIETGIMLTKPRMAIAAISKLGTFDRAATQQEQNLVIVGEWKREHKEDNNLGNFQIYLVMLLDENNQTLHDIPLKLVAKGAFQASLSENWQQFCTHMARLKAKARKAPFRPQNEIFNSLCVFCPIFKRQMVGGKTKSPACYVNGYVEPNTENWLSFFVGADEVIADQIVEIMNPQPRLLLPAPVQNMTAIPSDSESPKPALAPAANPIPTATQAQTQMVTNGFLPTKHTKDEPAIEVPAQTVEDDRIPF